MFSSLFGGGDEVSQLPSFIVEVNLMHDVAQLSRFSV